MFSSSGYFRGVNCPYFASGLCDRAYCHFRHSKPPEEKPKENLTSYSAKTGPSYSFNSSQISGYSASPYLQKSVVGYIDNYSSNESPNQSSSQESCSNKDSNSTSNGNNSKCPIPSFSESSSTLPQSAPEPEIDRQSLPKISGLAKRKFCAPSYNPTPKNLATDLETNSQENNDVPSYHPTPKIVSVNGASVPGKKSVIKYDPVKNYAVNPKQYSSASDDENEHQINTTSHEPEFSADEEENENSELVNHHHAEKESENHDKQNSKRPSVTNYADLLTPSSYFTNKLSSLSTSSRAVDGSTDEPGFSSATRENGCIDKQSSSYSAGNNKLSNSKSPSHSSTSSKSKSKSSSHRDSSSSSKEHGSKSHSISSSSRSSSSSKSSSSKSSSSKSSSSKSSSSSSRSSSSSNLPHNVHGSKHSKHSSSESKRKSDHHSEETHSASKKDKANSSSGSKTTHSSQMRSRSSSSDSKHSVTKKHTSGDKESSRHESDHKKHGSKTNNATITSHSSSSSSHELKRSISGSELTTKTPSSDKSICRSTSLNEKVKKSHNDVAKVKEERKSLDMNNTCSERDKRKDNHSDSKRTKPNDKERRQSHDSRREKVKREIKLEKKTKSAQERHFSDITSNLFGEESDGSDSDVQIVEPPPQPPPEILELTDSDEEKYGDNEFLNEEDLNFSDTDTFDECLRIFQETDRKLKFQKRSAPPGALQEVEPSNKCDLDDSNAIPGKKRMAHSSSQQVVRFKPPVPKPRLGPAEVMHNRIVEMQKRALMRAAKREGREADLPRLLKSNSITSNATPAASDHRTSLTGSYGSGSRSTGLVEMAISASSLTSNQKKRESHLPSTPTKTMPNANSKGLVWPPNSFYTKKSHGAGGMDKGKSGNSGSSKMVTIAGTASKTEKRKAHVPTSVNLKRPLIAAGDSSKVPINVRQRYLNLIIDEFLKFRQEETAYEKGQEEEKEVYKRATNKNIYLRLVVNAIKRIRTEAAQSQPSSSKKPKLDYSAMASRGSSSVLQSHEATLGGSRAAKTSYTLNRSGPQRVQLEFKGVELYNRLKKYLMTEEQLRENSYPRSSEDGRSIAKYYTTKVKDSLFKDNERLCRRCGKRYYVQEDGTPVTEQECIYHYANMYKKKVAGSLDSRYGCCNERAGVKGCQVANTHVNEVNKYENITGYMKTLPSAESDPKNTKVLSLDCEMVYTKAGMELARVTVIEDDCQVLYETFVKPDTDIIDYNTRFSGITAKDMKGVDTTLRGVQAVMLSMITEQTILIGHSLESDLTALKLIHSTVVDTSIVFPHRLGLPYKRALRNLMVDHLQKIIQNDDGGHDSKEDAVSCMQLMIYKIKQDAKSECRRF